MLLFEDLFDFNFEPTVHEADCRPEICQMVLRLAVTEASEYIAPDLRWSINCRSLGLIRPRGGPVHIRLDVLVPIMPVDRQMILMGQVFK